MHKERTLRVRVRTKVLPLSRADAALLQRSNSFDWIFLTSKHAAAHFARALSKQRISLLTARVAAIGRATAAAARRSGLRVAFVSAKPTSLGFAAALAKRYNLKGARILSPRSASASNDAIRRLRAHGAIVRTLSLYATEAVPLMKKERNGLATGTYASLSFSSPSGVRGLLGMLDAAERRRALRLPAHCVGPVTAMAARKAGFKKVIS